MAMFLAVSVLTGGCASSPKQYTIRGEADPILNRDINGKSLSVVVRVYQLSDAQEFSKLTFDTLASGRPESDFLGNALLDKTDAVVIPGGSYENSQKLLDETKFVGIVAFFRKPDPYYWRQLADAETIRRHGLSFRVQDCYVALTEGDAIQLPGQPSSYRPDCGSPAQSILLNTRPARGNTTIGIDDALPAAKRLLLPR
jgi:type VI secretion system protein VasD